MVVKYSLLAIKNVDFLIVIQKQSQENVNEIYSYTGA